MFQRREVLFSLHARGLYSYLYNNTLQKLTQFGPTRVQLASLVFSRYTKQENRHSGSERGRGRGKGILEWVVRILIGGPNCNS